MGPEELQRRLRQIGVGFNLGDGRPVPERNSFDGCVPLGRILESGQSEVLLRGLDLSLESNEPSQVDPERLSGHRGVPLLVAVAQRQNGVALDRLIVDRRHPGRLCAGGEEHRHEDGRSHEFNTSAHLLPVDRARILRRVFRCGFRSGSRPHLLEEFEHRRCHLLFWSRNEQDVASDHGSRSKALESYLLRGPQRNGRNANLVPHLDDLVDTDANRLYPQASHLDEGRGRRGERTVPVDPLAPRRRPRPPPRSLRPDGGTPRDAGRRRHVVVRQVSIDRKIDPYLGRFLGSAASPLSSLTASATSSTYRSKPTAAMCPDWVSLRMLPAPRISRSRIASWNPEPEIGELADRFEPAVGVLRETLLLGMEQVGVGPLGRTPDPAPQLVELGETEPIGPLDDQACSPAEGRARTR